MKRDREIKFNRCIQWIADHYTDIATGAPGEFKKVVSRTPISDSGGTAVFEKASTGKRALAFFLWHNRSNDFLWWFPSDSDLLLFERVQDYRERVEEFNLEKEGELCATSSAS